MKKGIPFLVVLAICLIAAPLLFGSGQGEAGKGAVAPGQRKVLEYDIVRYASGGQPDRPSLYEQEMVTRFGIKFKYQDIPTQGAIEKLNVLYASREEPHVILGGPGGGDMKRWGQEGYLVPLSDYLTRLPNYMKYWNGKKMWDIVYAFNKAADGKLYYLPFNNVRLGAHAWIWRKGTMDKMGLPFPKTMEELYATAKAIKAKVPDSIPITGRSKLDFLITSFGLSYRTARDFYVDSDLGGKLVYGPQTSNFRDMLKFLKRIYGEGLLDSEILTLSGEQWTERYAQGKPYVNFDYGTRADWANSTMAKADPNAGWDWSREGIRGYPDKKAMGLRENYYFDYGPIVSKKCSQEQIDRLIEYFDWSATEEGMVFSNFGVAGVTFDTVGGVPVFKDSIYTVKNLKGDQTWKWGFDYFLFRHPAAADQQQGIAQMQISDAIAAQDWIRKIAWNMTTQESKTLADLEPPLNDARDEYATKFILGKLDPGSDADWAEFQDRMNKAGLDKALALRGEILKKSIQE